MFSGQSSGTAAERNQQGLQVLNEIRGDPKAQTQALDNVTDVKDSAGRGARFKHSDGSFMGFLEPIT